MAKTQKKLSKLKSNYSSRKSHTRSSRPKSSRGRSISGKNINPIYHISEQIFKNVLKSDPSSALNGCKNFGSKYLVEYLIYRKLILEIEREHYFTILMNIELRLNNTMIYLTQKTPNLDILNLNFQARFFNDLNQDSFNEFTKNSIVFCSMFKPNTSDGIVAIHTFIIVNDDINYIELSDQVMRETFHLDLFV